MVCEADDRQRGHERDRNRYAGQRVGDVFANQCDRTHDTGREGFDQVADGDGLRRPCAGRGTRVWHSQPRWSEKRHVAGLRRSRSREHRFRSLPGMPAGGSMSASEVAVPSLAGPPDGRRSRRQQTGADRVRRQNRNTPDHDHGGEVAADQSNRLRVRQVIVQNDGRLREAEPVPVVESEQVLVLQPYGSRGDRRHRSSPRH